MMFSSMKPSGRPHQQLVLSEQELEIGLEKFCRVPDRQKGIIRIAESNVQRIRIILKELDMKYGRVDQESQWHLRPRTYSILRNIGCLDAMGLFIQTRLNDFHLPYNEQTLPAFVERLENNDFRHAFLETQSYFLSDFKDVEIESSKHRHFMFQDSGDAHFASQRLLGQGGFGAVDLVVSRLSFRRYARKRVLRGRDSENNRRVQTSIIEELNQLKRLNHRHLVKVIGSYTDREYIAYLMSPVAHGTLEQFLTMSGDLYSGQLEMLRQFYGCLAGAVHHLHKNYIRHRDLTTRNILIYDNRVYISDFGSAYNWAHQPTSNTQHLNIPVSPDYMAPEIARREEVGSASDMWSLGVVFLEMTTRLLGRTTDELRRHISSHARQTKAAPYIHANYPVVESWLEVLHHDNTASERDNEPLIWTQDLLRMMPRDRPSSRVLMKEILESSFFTIFSCFKCHRDFQDGGFAYDSCVSSPEPQGMTDTTATIFQDAITLQHPVTPFINQTRGCLYKPTEPCGIRNCFQQSQYPDTREHDSYSDAASDEYPLYGSYGYDNSWVGTPRYPQLHHDDEDPLTSLTYKSFRMPASTRRCQASVTPKCNQEEHQAIINPVDEKNFRDTGLGFLEYDSSSSVCRLFDEISEYSESSLDEDEYHSIYSTARNSPEIAPGEGDLHVHDDISGYFRPHPEPRLADETVRRLKSNGRLSDAKIDNLDAVTARVAEYQPVKNTLLHGSNGNIDEHQTLLAGTPEMRGFTRETTGSSRLELDVDASRRSGSIDYENPTALPEPKQKLQSFTASRLYAQVRFEKIESNPASDVYLLPPNTATLLSRPGNSTRRTNFLKPALSSFSTERMHGLLRRCYFESKSKAVQLIFQHECNPKTIFFP